MFVWLFVVKVQVGEEGVPRRPVPRLRSRWHTDGAYGRGERQLGPQTAARRELDGRIARVGGELLPLKIKS